MTIRSQLLIAGVLLFITITDIHASGKQQENIQTSIHLLDYIARDYARAVKNGEIINEFEYKEMQEFSKTVDDLAETYLKEKPTETREPIRSKLKELKQAVNQKSSRETVATIAKSIKSQIITVTDFKVTPAEWPDLANGKKIYRNKCMSCHGKQGGGDGQLAPNLKVAPTDFLDDELMKQVSAFQAFNTIRLGIEGTSMRSFKELSDKEIWDLAFYIKSLRFQNATDEKSELAKQFRKGAKAAGLKQVATLSDEQLASRLDSLKGNSSKMLAALRLEEPSEKSGGNSLQLAKNYLQDALSAYQNQNPGQARQQALAAYLEGIEPVEAQLKAGNPEFTSRLEQQMIKVRNAIENEKPTKAVQEEVRASIGLIDRAAEIMDEGKITPWLSFILTSSILLREGVEAFLIIALMLTLIRTSGVRKARYWVHGGWLTAVVLGLAGWFFSDWVLKISGASREVMEGMVALLAVLILSSVGFWLHNHSHAQKWKDFIENKVHRYLRTKNMFGLAVFAFIVVFREAFESVLFIQAINIQTAPTDNYSIGLGALAATVLILVFVVLFLKYSKNIPIRPLFRYSSWLITLLAFILIGKGFHAIQEAGWVSITHSPVSLNVSWLGIYPTVETIMAQVLFLGLMLMLYYFNSRKLSVKTVRTNN